MRSCTSAGKDCMIEPGGSPGDPGRSTGDPGGSSGDPWGIPGDLRGSLGDPEGSPGDLGVEMFWNCLEWMGLVAGAWGMVGS